MSASLQQQALNIHGVCRENIAGPRLAPSGDRVWRRWSEEEKEERKNNVPQEANGLHVAETRHTDRVAASGDDGLVSDGELSGVPSIRGGSALTVTLFVFLAATG